MAPEGFSPEAIQLGPVILALLFVAIVFIVYATAKWKLHPFISIIAATYILALGTNLIAKLNGIEAPLIKDIGATAGFLGNCNFLRNNR